jgi:hypothetical protein
MRARVLAVSGLSGLSLIAAALGPGALAAEAFRWVDDEGLVHYSDSAPDEATSVTVVDLVEAPTYDAEQDPYSIINQAARIHERWIDIEQRGNERRAARARASGPEPGTASPRFADARAYAEEWHGIGRPVASGFRSSGFRSSLTARRQLRALQELDLLQPRPYSINSGAHHERVARSSGLPAAGRPPLRVGERFGSGAPRE